jgi:hypothetical protein
MEKRQHGKGEKSVNEKSFHATVPKENVRVKINVSRRMTSGE